MRDLIAWWYDFVERHPDYTHTDDLQYPDQQSLAELQQAMADEAVRYTQPANNDELIALAAFVYAFKIGSKLCHKFLEHFTYTPKGRERMERDRRICEVFKKLMTELS